MDKKPEESTSEGRVVGSLPRELGTAGKKMYFCSKNRTKNDRQRSLAVSATYGAGRVGFKVIPTRTDAVQSLIPPWPADTLRGLISHLDLQYLHFRKYTNPPGAG